MALVAKQLLGPGGLLVLATPRVRAGYETATRAMPSGWQRTVGAAPPGWRASPVRGLSEADGRTLLPELAAETYPLDWLCFRSPPSLLSWLHTCLSA